MDQVAKQSTVDRLSQANNVLVTVSANPSVDQLAAAIGLTLFLNKQGKHATAVFSGDVPSTLEFLQPDKTIEKNTDSLRDFIISLDKAKADKLRYKVEDSVVKIFITPYRTSITEKDFDFSQGDFNVDVVMALGVHSKEELDQAIIAHGRILHDATVISINNVTAGSLGTINWQDQQASSLCEMLVELAEVIKADSFDAQMATAFLTGIVAETKRFSNEKTTSRTMSLSAKLMAAGANQQLVATQLQSKSSIAKSKPSKGGDGEDGTLEIEHDDKKEEQPPTTLPQPQPDQFTEDRPIANSLTPASSSSSFGPSTPASPIKDVREETGNDNAAGLFDRPSRGGPLTANTKPEDLSPSIDPLSADPLGPNANQPLLNRAAADDNLGNKTLSNIEDAVIDQDKTLTDIEQSLGSPKAAASMPTSQPAAARPVAGLDSARDAVEAAAATGPAPRLEPRQDIATQGRLDVNAAAPAPTPNYGIPADAGLPPEQTGVSAPAAPPPPVPPPMTAAFPPQIPPAN